MATANLSVESKDFTLPVVEATAGADGIVVSTLRNDGWVTLDPGFLTTALCESKMTYIDGKNSILRYRGYPIEQLCEQSDFLEGAWLLRHGELPNQEQYDRFISDINHRTMVGEDFRTFMGSFPRTAHPMSVMASAVNALATFYPDTTDINDSDQLDEAATIIMAKARTIVSYIFRRRRDEPMLYPDYSRGYVDDFLRMCFAVPYEPFDSDPLYVHALGRLLIIHADHEQNASTSTVRLCASSGTSPFAAIAAGVACLWGPQHGGANEATLSMLYHIQEEGGIAKIGDFIKKVKDKSSGVRLMGFGHRVYKNYDPRAKLMRETCYEVLDELGLHDSPIFKLALALEKIALEDEYFISRNLYPNVDFYSGIVQKAIGIPMPLFTAIFAMARTVGWFAQLNEMIDDPAFRIGRPRQLFTGSTERHVKPIEER